MNFIFFVGKYFTKSLWTWVRTTKHKYRNKKYKKKIRISDSIKHLDLNIFMGIWRMLLHCDKKNSLGIININIHFVSHLFVLLKNRLWYIRRNWCRLYRKRKRKIVAFKSIISNCFFKEKGERYKKAKSIHWHGFFYSLN